MGLLINTRTKFLDIKHWNAKSLCTGFSVSTNNFISFEVTRIGTSQSLFPNFNLNDSLPSVTLQVQNFQL